MHEYEAQSFTFHIVFKLAINRRNQVSPIKSMVVGFDNLTKGYQIYRKEYVGFECAAILSQKTLLSSISKAK